MAQIELSLTEPLVRPGLREQPATNLDRWVEAVENAIEPSMVLDDGSIILATSKSCSVLFGLGGPDATVGRFVADVLQLVDFTAARTELDETDIGKIPPLLALTSRRLARGILRVQCGDDPSRIRTVDAIATPVWGCGQEPAGSLTFFSEV